MKKVSVIIVDYKNKVDTIACIASLEDLVLTNIALSIILVNNDTESFYTSDMFPSTYPLHIINSKKNTGFAGGNNTGMTKALQESADYILILNNDTLVDKNLLISLIKVLEKNPEVGVASPKIYFVKGNEFHKDRYKKDELGRVFWYAGGIMDWNNVFGKHRGVDEVDRGQFSHIESTEVATGCCMIFRSEVIKKVGMFDERYFLYYEDTDLSQRIKNNGYSIFYVPTAMLWHKNAGSTGGSGSALQDYYISRNRLLFGMKYAPIRSKVALLKESVYLLRKGRLWQRRGIRDYFLNKFGKGSYTVS